MWVDDSGQIHRNPVKKPSARPPAFASLPVRNYGSSIQIDSIRTFLISAGTVLLFIFVVSQCNNISQKKFQTQTAKTTTVYATVANTDWVNVRSGPSDNDNQNIITQIKKGTRVEIVEWRSNAWVRVRYNNGKTGYVYGRYLLR